MRSAWVGESSTTRILPLAMRGPGYQRPCASPPGEAAPAVTLPDAEAAYAVQEGVASSLDWFGENTPRHWKSGAPSAAALQTHAPLPPAGVWSSPADARAWPFHLRGIEAENVAHRLEHLPPLLLGDVVVGPQHFDQ